MAINTNVVNDFFSNLGKPTAPTGNNSSAVTNFFSQFPSPTPSVAPTPTASPAVQKTLTQLNLGQQISNTFSNIVKGFTFTFTQPKIISPIPNPMKPTPQPTPQPILSLKPNQTKLTGSQLNQLTPMVTKGAGVSGQLLPDALTKISSTLSKEFPQSSQALQKVQSDPLNLKASPNKIINDAWEAIKQPTAEYIKRALIAKAPSKTISEKVGKEVLKYTGAAGVAFSPLNAIFAVANDIPIIGAFTKLLTLPFLTVGEGAPKISNSIIDQLPISQQTKKNLKPAVGEVFTLAAQLALGKFMEISTKNIGPYVKATGIDVFEKLTKDMIEQVNGPRTINIPVSKVREVIIGTNTGIEKNILSNLGLSSKEWVNAAKNGVSIQFPTEKLIRIIDKPYWEKLKSLLGQEPTNRVIGTSAIGTVQQGIAGLLTAGEHTSQELLGKVIANKLENTPEGKAIIKVASQAQQSGQNIVVSKTPEIESSVVQKVSPTGEKTYQVIPKGQLEQFKTVIDNSGGTVVKDSQGNTVHLTAKTPQQMEVLGFKNGGTADITQIPKPNIVQPLEVRPIVASPNAPKTAGINKPLSTSQSKAVQASFIDRMEQLRQTAGGQNDLITGINKIIEDTVKVSQGDKTVLSGLRTALNKEMFGISGTSGVGFKGDYAKLQAEMDNPDIGNYLKTLESSIWKIDNLLAQPIEITSKPTTASKVTPAITITKYPESEVAVPRTQLPIGEGKVKVSQLEARMTGVLDTMTPEQIKTLGTTTYNEMNNKDTINKAAEYVVNNPEEAIKVLTGELPPPKGLNVNSIYVAIANSENVPYEVATKVSTLSSTAMGQNIEILKELNPNSPIKIISDIYKVREKVFEKRYGGKTAKEVTDTYIKKGEAKIQTPKLTDWGSIIKQVRC